MNIVIKLGGNAMTDEVQQSFADRVATLQEAGSNVAVVHGGGPQIAAALEREKITSAWKDGLRVTTAGAIEVIHSALLGVQKELVNVMPNAVGMSTSEPGVFKCTQHVIAQDGQPFDFGFVGDVVEVDTKPVVDAFDDGLVPVVTCIGVGVDNTSIYNINGDIAAAALAAALDADLVMVTNVPGLYGDWPDRASLISRLRVNEAVELLPKLEGGMQPKVQAAIGAVVGGARSAVMIGSDDLGRIGELFDGERAADFGTRVVRDGSE